MSYTKTTGIIKFSYDRGTLFNDISLMSNYMCKNMTSKDGNSLTDDFAISDDETDLVNVCIRNVLPDIYESLIKITTAVVPAFDDDESVTTGAGTANETTTHYVWFKIQDNDNYNNNVLSMVDASLYNCLKIGTLKCIYSKLVQPELFNVCSARFLSEIFKLKQRLFQLKKKSVSSNLN